MSIARGRTAGAIAALVAVTACNLGRSDVVPPDPPLRLLMGHAPDLIRGAGPDFPFGLALAPDGRRVVYPASRDGHVSLWLRDLATDAEEALPGTDGAVLPFWAPSGDAVGFFADGRLTLYHLAESRLTLLADAPQPRGGAWHPDGDIVFAPRDDGGLQRVDVATRVVTPLTSLDAAGGETSHRFPTWVRQGERLAFLVRAPGTARHGVWTAPRADPSARTRLVGTDAQVVAVDDLVLYAEGDALVAHRIDAATHRLLGRPTLLGSPVGRGPLGQLMASGSPSLVLYAAPSSGLRELRWVDRSGRITRTIGDPTIAWDVRATPDGVRVAVARVEPPLNTLDIWVYEGQKPLPVRLSTALDADESPVWSPDGSRVAWISARRAITIRDVRRARPESTGHRFDRTARLSDWSGDGRWLIASETAEDGRDDLWVVAADGRQPPARYATSSFNERHGVVSPDGRWLAYASDESGQFDVYVDRFPTPGRRGRLTVGGGLEPRWRRDGRELYFRRGTAIHAVTLTLSGAAPEALSSASLFDAGHEIRAYDVSNGGEFLLNVAPEGARVPSTMAVLNWRGLVPE